MNVSLTSAFLSWFTTLAIYVLLIALAIFKWRRLVLFGRLAWILMFVGWTLVTAGFYSYDPHLQKVGSYIMLSGGVVWIMCNTFLQSKH
jgi:hypothetical protein